MKERPILFSAPMVRAILEGTKTQTRRVVKPQPKGAVFHDGQWLDGGYGEAGDTAMHCPYGEPGDRLWVRESFSGVHDYDAGHDGNPWPPSAWFQDDPIWYWADGNPAHGDWTRPRPSIHMPRWASRIMLEITDVRVQRLQDISEADAVAEGIMRDEIGGAYASEAPLNYATAVAAYAGLWDSINGAGTWAANPWVWAVSFQQVQS